MRNLYQFFGGFKEGMRSFGETINILVVSILLVFVYFVGVGLTSLFAKLSGKHLLTLRLSKRDSYWSDLTLSKKSEEFYYRQF